MSATRSTRTERVLTLVAVSLGLVLWGGAPLFGDEPRSVAAATASRRPLTASELRGRRIYREGRGGAPGGVAARLGDAATEVPATLLPCANCHGFDGRGVPEGGVVPTDLRWPVLRRSYGPAAPSRRRHRPYDREALGRAIAEGRDPSGNRLDVAMPRYRMSDEDLRDLTAYLLALHREAQPGIASDVLTVATVIPERGPLRGAGELVRRVLEVAFEEINAKGGVCGRTLRLTTASPAALLGGAVRSTPAAGGTPGAASATGDEPELDVCALICPFESEGARHDGARAEGDRPQPAAELTLAADASGTPVIAPLSMGHRAAASESVHLPGVFRLLSDAGTQVRALVADVARRARPGAGRLLVIARDDEPFRALRDVASDAGAARGLSVRALSVVEWRATAAGERRQALADADELLLLAPAGEHAALWVGDTELPMPANLTLLGGTVGPETFRLPPRLQGRVRALFPNCRSASRPEALAHLRELLRERRIARAPTALSVHAYCAAQLLAEGLKRAGRDLRRETLERALAEIRDFETGLMPPLSYGPYRRVGARGAYLVQVDIARRAFAPRGRWLEP